MKKFERMFVREGSRIVALATSKGYAGYTGYSYEHIRFLASKGSIKPYCFIGHTACYEINIEESARRKKCQERKPSKRR